MQSLLTQIAKFGLVGVLATVIDFLVMILLHELLGIDAVVSAGISFTVSLVFNYLASMRYVFKRRDDLSRAHEMAIFLLLSLIGLALNELIMYVGQLVLESHGIPFQEGLMYVAIKVLATGIVMIWNFVSRKKWLEAPADTSQLSS